MDEEVQESFLTGEILRRQNSRFSTLRLRFRRTLPAWSTRYLLPSLILGAVILYFGPNLLFSDSGVAWSSKLQYEGPVTDSDEWARRATAVRDAFIRVYGVYEKEAFPKDELKPITHKAVQMYVSAHNNANFNLLDRMNGWGLSAVDSLDTMILMNLIPQINSTIKFISTLDFKHKHVSGRLFVKAKLNKYNLMTAIKAHTILRNDHPISWRFTLRLPSYRGGCPTSESRRTWRDVACSIQYS
jgi:hypothetical protein